MNDGAPLNYCNPLFFIEFFELSKNDVLLPSNPLRLEQSRIELMPLQQFVELSAIAFGHARCVGHVAIGYFQQLRQIFALEFASCLLERSQFGLLALDRLFDQTQGNQRRVASAMDCSMTL